MSNVAADFCPNQSRGIPDSACLLQSQWHIVDKIGHIKVDIRSDIFFIQPYKEWISDLYPVLKKKALLVLLVPEIVYVQTYQ